MFPKHQDFPSSSSTPILATAASRPWAQRPLVLGLLAVYACEGGSGADVDGDETGPSLVTFDDGGQTADAETTDAATTDAEPSTDGSSGPDPLDCGESQFVLQATPARLVLVLDKSGSMALNSWDHDGDPTTAEITRWASLYATVEYVTASFDGSLELGALLYPSIGATSTYDENACVVGNAPEVAPGPMHAEDIMGVLPGPLETDVIQGGTPSAAAVAVAVASLLSLDAPGSRAILFVTDGEANCRADAEVGPELFEDYDFSLHEVVEDAWEGEGIPTYVVGIAIRDQLLPNAVDGSPDGINPHEQLELLADQGGRPRADADARYYAADDQLELEAALSAIAAEQFDCTVVLDPVPNDPEYVSIEIGGESVDRVDDCESEDGWRWSQQGGPYDRIVLCGAACDQLAALGTLDATYGCPPAP